MAQVKPMRADARRNYERLLKAAAAAFAEHGEQASLDDIARRAGVGSGTLYRHFPTRQALLEAVYVDAVEALGNRADEIAGELPPGEALAEWLFEVCVGTIEVRGLKSLLGSAVTDGSNAALTACATHMKGAAERLVVAAQRDGALRADVEPIDVLRLAHGVSSASELANGGSEHLRRYLSFLTEGLRPAAG
ncbi:TetR/AcrR family transcriptional regulator [Streptomyces spinosirectus]